MKTRKILLLAAIFVFAVIFALQTVFSSKSPVKEFKIDSPANSIEIESKDYGKIILSKEGENWKVNQEDADNESAAMIEESLKTIKTLGIATKSQDQVTDERYGFTENQKITVTVKNGDKTLRSLTVGKDTANGQQNYIRIDGSSDVYIATGALRSKLAVSQEELVKKEEAEAQPDSESQSAAGPVLPQAESGENQENLEKPESQENTL